MANLLKTKPIGLDAVIHEIQVSLYKLKDKWNINLEGYPRCYILNNGKGNKTIESYLGKEQYSGSLIFAEKNKFFFVAGEKEFMFKKPDLFTSTIEIYFFLNTKQCYPNILHKADQEVRTDVVSLLSKLPIINVINIESNSDKVFNRFNNRISQGYESEYTDTMGNYHYFKCMLELNPYRIKKQICSQ
jgi:hypothetical protein